MKRITEAEMKELSMLYNEKGKLAVYAEIKEHYHVKYPYGVLRRMKNTPTLGYQPEQDRFSPQKTGPDFSHEDELFMSIDDLCAPLATPAAAMGIQSMNERVTRSAAMETLVHELIGDRLLQLSRYVSMDMMSKTIIVDRTSLTSDGYQLMVH